MNIKNNIKDLLRPTWRCFYKYYDVLRIKNKTLQVPIKKLLKGGENGIRAAKYAELSEDFLRPSTSILEGHHVQFLKQYDELGDEILKENNLKKTPYYKNASKCIELTGSYFYDTPDKIKILLERFVAQYKGKKLNLEKQPGQSDTDQPIWVRPIRASSYYEVIDGNHRIARAIMRGDETIPAIIYEKEAVYTPLQQLLLDCLWINKQKWLYQPVESLELNDEWILVRDSKDRLNMMQSFMQKEGLLNKSKGKKYIDIGSSYGWFVNEFGKMGFDAYGIDRDPFGMEIGFKVYGLNKKQIIHSDIIIGLKKLVAEKKTFDTVSCLSVLHHFVLHKSSTTAVDFIKLIDNITENILFLDTGEEHETAFENQLQGWSPEFIQKWILENTSFKKVIPLGIDNDRKPPFEGYYNRTLFACIK